MLSSTPLALPRPDAIAGYDILSVLGQVGQGVVYLAVQKATQRHVALRALPRLRGEHGSLAARTEVESWPQVPVVSGSAGRQFT